MGGKVGMGQWLYLPAICAWVEKKGGARVTGCFSDDENES